MSTTPAPDSLLAPILALHDRIRDQVLAATERQDLAALSRVAAETAGDTIFAIDRIGEEALVAELEARLAGGPPVVLVAEGLAGGELVLPRGARAADAAWRVLVDPIDGTRGLMYQKRPAWILTGVAPNRGPATSLADVVLAVQTEIPLVKQHLADQLWAIRGRGVRAERIHRFTGERRAIAPRPSGASDLAQGFAMIARFFPGGRDVLAAIDEEVVREVLGPPAAGRALCFEDQYLSTGGQLHELGAGHDRFVADLRPLLAPLLAARGEPAPLCCHPYDLAAVLIATELGVEVTDARGRPLDAPLDVETAVAWVGYANRAIRARVEPALQAALRRRGLLP
ncbi:MAG: inositol monophosphatase [Planctomycetota bacterium]